MAGMGIGEQQRKGSENAEDEERRYKPRRAAERRVVAHQTDRSYFPNSPSGLIIRTAIIRANSTAGVQ